MKKLSLEEIKQINMNTLHYFSNFCKEHNLQYYLAFGTLLGAVRHKGFIPWDDDIDVLMPRSDYDKLEAVAEELNNDRWELLSYNLKSKYLMPYMKIHDKTTLLKPSRFCSGFMYGLSIDVFPLDTVPYKDDLQAKEYCNKTRQQIHLLYEKSYARGVVTLGIVSFFKRIIKRVLYIIKNNEEQMKREYRILEGELRETDNHEYPFVFYFYNIYETLWENEDFVGKNGEKKSLSFEGEEFYVPSNYNNVLKATYGDYMTLPPEEKRVCNHSYKAYRITKGV